MLRPADSIRLARRLNLLKATQTMSNPARGKGQKPWRTLVANKMVGVRILRSRLGPVGNQTTFGLGGVSYDRGLGVNRLRRAG